MYNALCHSGSLGSLGNLGLWSGVGLILNLVLWIGLIAGFALLVVLAIRKARVPAAIFPAGGQPTAKEILQDQYARKIRSR
jgi:Flp pilus assembly protein protease CpaA